MKIILILLWLALIAGSRLKAQNWIIDSLITTGNYKNALNVIKDSAPDDSSLRFYQLICQYKLNEKEFLKTLSKEIFQHDTILYSNLMGSVYLENGKWNEGLKEFESVIDQDPTNIWARFRIWELQTILNKNFYPITINLSRFDTLSLVLFDSLDLGIYYLGTAQEEKAIDYFRLLSRKMQDIYKYHLFNYLLADKRNDYFEKDYEYQVIWKLSGSRGYQFNDQVKTYLRFMARWTELRKKFNKS